MKNMQSFNQRLTGFGIALAIAGLACLPGTALAQEKGAQKLMKVQTVENVQSIEAGDTIVMHCGKCKDTYTHVAEKSLKGANASDMKTVGVHLCSSCETKLVTKGVGKQAKDVLVHTCKACGSEDVSCCVIKKGSHATHDKEKK